MNSKHVILNIILDLELAGAQETLCSLMEYWPDGEFEPIVCALKDGPLRKRIERAGVKVLIVDGPRCNYKNIFMFISELRRIRRELLKIIMAYHVDLIQTHIIGFLDFLILTFQYKRKVNFFLWTIHGPDFLPLRPGIGLKIRRYIFLILYRIFVHKVTLIIAVSRGVKKSVVGQLGAIRHKVYTIENCVNLKKIRGVQADSSLRRDLGLGCEEKIVLTVGRLAEEKGHRFLIRAVAEVMAYYPETHFIIVGKGPLRDELEGEATACGFPQNVHFLGDREDIFSLLTSADLFVLPSLREGLPLALLEAMASSLPVVATDINGISEIIFDGKTGLVVPPGDRYALAAAINLLFSNPSKAERLAEHGRDFVTAHFGCEKQIEGYVRLYRKLLGSRSA